MRNALYCSTGAFVGRVNGRNHLLIPELAERLDCDGFEFMLCDNWRGSLLERVCCDLEGVGLKLPVAHIAKGLGDAISRNAPGDAEDVLDWFEESCRAARRLRAKLLVLHLWSGAASDGDMPRIYQSYDALWRRATDEGLLLTVENVPCAHTDPLSHWRELIARNPEAAFTLDTRFAVFHQQMPALLNEAALWAAPTAVPAAAPAHVRHIHVSEYAGGHEPLRWDRLRPILHPGEGETDFPGFFAALAARGYQGGVTLESPAMSERGTDVERLNQSLRMLQGWLDRPNNAMEV